jgi:hypothetical protein
MRNSILAGVMVSCMILGGIIGGGINEIQRNNETDAAWDRVVVVADGQLVANPAYYADHPEELAKARNVKIIDARGAAIEQAFHS